MVDRFLHAASDAHIGLCQKFMPADAIYNGKMLVI
jgi:hypothetical protein